MITDYSNNSKVWTINYQVKKLESGFIQMVQLPMGGYKILIVFDDRVINAENQNLENFFSCKTEATLKLVNFIDNEIDSAINIRNDLIAEVEESEEVIRDTTVESKVYDLSFIE